MAGKRDAHDDIVESHIELKNLFRLHWLHWLILIGSLIVTLFAYHFSKQQIEQKIQERFENAASHTRELISERMEKYEEALWAGVGTIQSQNDGLDYQEWKRFASVLKIEQRFPGINGIGVIYHVKLGELESYLRREREMRPHFEIYPLHTHDEYWPITFIEPIEGNIKAVGLDMAHEKNRISAAKKARDTGEAQITGPITLAQDENKTPGFLFYVPFYHGDTSDQQSRRSNFAGLVYAPFIMNKLMEGVLEKEKRELKIHIYDDGDLLYTDDETETIGGHHKSLYTKIIDLNIYGRHWKLEIESTHAFEKAVRNTHPYIILIGGIFIDILFLLIFILLSHTNLKAVKLANRATEEYKKKARDLDAAQKFQTTLLNSIPDLIFVKDDQFRIVQANPAFMNVYPESMQDKVIGYTTFEAYDPKEAEAFLKRDRLAFEKGVSETEETVHFPDGEQRILLTKKVRFEDSTGQQFIVGMGRDITSRKRAEADLSSLGGLVEDSLNEVYIFHAETLKFIQVNRGARENMGYSMSKFKKMTPVDIKPEYTEEAFLETLIPLQQGKEKNVTFETLHQRKDGSTYNVEVHLQIAEYQGQKAFVAFVLDITERKNIEAELRQTQKMEALGHLAGGVAHEINNFLQPIMFGTEILKQTFETEPIVQKQVAMMMRNLTAARHVVQDVLKFSRLDEAEPEQLPVISTINNAVEFTTHLLPATIQINISGLKNEKAKSDHTAYMNENDLICVISNIVGNASDAMEGQGKIGIVHKYQILKPATAAKHALDPGLYSVLKIKDTGVGIPEKDLETIFNPFFTTKPVGEGTGLGLSSAYGIIGRWGGNITVESKEGKGTIFTIFIPATDKTTKNK